MPRNRAVCIIVAAGLAAFSLASCADQNPTDNQFNVSDDAGDTSTPGEQKDTGVESMDVGDTAPDRDTAPDTTEGDTDSGDADVSVDAIRRVVDRDFFGELPIENYFLDATFRGVTTWLPLEVENGRPVGYSEGYREVYSESPLSAAVFRVPAAGSATDVRVLGQVTLRQQPLDVSIWIGREGQFDGSVEIELIGVTADDPTSYKRASLSAESDSEQKIGDIRWKKFSKQVTGFFGRGYLTVQGSLGSSLYLHGPVAQDAPSMPGGLRPFARQQLEPATALDRASIRTMRQWTRRHRPDPRDQRLGPPMQYFTPGLP